RVGGSPIRSHSSGTTVGLALLPDASAGPGVSDRIAGAVLLSGMYNLEPVRLSYVNDALRLDESAALRNSPIRRLPARLPETVVARGGNETEEYVRQHDRMVTALRSRAVVTEVVADRRDHFDLPYDLGVPGTGLGDAVLAQMRLEGRTA
ncbi:alpha/beta hydrolase, partial [Streptomyces sp. NPDC051098]